MIKGRLSVVIPNYNSPFASKTIQDVLDKSKGDIEVIVNVEMKWPEPIVEDARVTYIHGSEPIGMRAGINRAVAMSKGEFIMKCDDHVMFGEGFDEILKADMQPNWVIIPRRYALDAENWKIEERTDNKYPIDYMYIDFPRKGKDHDDGMHGVPWKRDRTEEIDDTPSMQGSCYFMTKDYFTNVLHGFSEEGYGQFAQESQELGFKTWLGGGAVKVNKKTFYCHLHKGSRYGRFYSFPGGTVEASSWSAEHWLNDREPNMVHKFEWFINEKFPGMPSWPSDWIEQIRGMGWIT
jgi:glycosyltransferase involved in cell wall biosynthesis